MHDVAGIRLINPEGERLAGSAGPRIEFRESTLAWRDLPEWVRYFVHLGYRWPNDDVRRIAVVSTPCDSAAAGLITLGAMLRRLGEPNANDLEAHVRRMLGLRTGHKGTLRRIHDKAVYSAERDLDGSIWLRRQSNDARYKFFEYHAGTWFFEGESPVEVIHGHSLPWAEHYHLLLPAGTSIDTTNLSTSDSTIVLAGRSTGTVAQTSVMASLCFRVDGAEATLLDLLSLQSHQPARTASRVRYLNPRAAAGQELDRPGSAPRTVVADGGDAFRFSMSSDDCEAASIIGHIPRTDDQSRLEEVGSALASLRSWYEVDRELSSLLPASPRGVELRVLRRRHSP